MDSRLINRLWLLFAIYTYYPVKLFPLIDYVKNHDNKFALTLLGNLQRVTYFKKFNELPLEDQKIQNKPTKQEIQDALETLPEIQNELVADFSRLIVKVWKGEGLAQLVQILNGIFSGLLQPEFPLPEDRFELAKWVEADLSQDENLRQVRSQMRELAKVSSEAY